MESKTKELNPKAQQQQQQQKKKQSKPVPQQKQISCESCVHYLQHYILTHNGGFRSIHSGHCINTIKNQHNNGFKFRDTSHTCEFYKKVTQKTIKNNHIKSLQIFLPAIYENLKIVADYLTYHNIN